MKRMQKCKLQILTLVMAVVMATAGFLAIFLGGGVLKRSDAYSSAYLPASIGSLTLSDYDTRTDGAVFDQAIMEKLYARLAGTTTATYKDAYSAVDGSTSVLTSPANNNPAYEDRQEHSKNYSQIIQTTPFSLEFGGFTWNVVYATTNTRAGNSDLIVTLWMSDLARDRTGTVITSAWGNFVDTDTAAAFPPICIPRAKSACKR